MEKNIKKRLIIELVFFSTTLLIFSGLYYGLGYLAGASFTFEQYVQSSIVSMLVIYLIRGVFIVMRMLK